MTVTIVDPLSGDYVRRMSNGEHLAFRLALGVAYRYGNDRDGAVDRLCELANNAEERADRLTMRGLHDEATDMMTCAQAYDAASAGLIIARADDVPVDCPVCGDYNCGY